MRSINKKFKYLSTRPDLLFKTSPFVTMFFFCTAGQLRLGVLGVLVECISPKEHSHLNKTSDVNVPDDLRGLI